MAYKHEWDNEAQTIYRLEFYDKWTWEKFSTGTNEAYKYLANAPKRIDFIVWFKGEVPRGNAFPHLKRAGGSQPPTIYRSVMIIEGSKLMELLTGMVVKAEKWEGPAFVKTIEEARALLAETQETSSNN